MEPSRRYSHKRDAIYEAICSTKSHPSAEWIYSKLKAGLPDLSLGTVYRNIALFREEGAVMRVATVAGQDRYDGNVAPHAHFICDLCGAVLDVEGFAPQEQLSHEVSQTLGARVDGCSLSFHGLCGECLQAGIKGNP